MEPETIEITKSVTDEAGNLLPETEVKISPDPIPQEAFTITLGELQEESAAHQRLIEQRMTDFNAQILELKTNKEKIDTQIEQIINS